MTLTNSDNRPHELALEVREATGTQADVTVSPSRVRLVGGERTQLRLDVALGTVDPDERDLDVSGLVTARLDDSDRDGLTAPYALSLRPLSLFATPDPAVDGSEVFLRAPVEIASAPVVTVRGPRQFRRTVTARHDHDTWWRAPVPTGPVGGYEVAATAPATTQYGGAELTGTTTFEVVAPGSQPGWRPVGPYGSGGELAPAPAGGDDVLVTSVHTATMFRTRNGGDSLEQLSNLPLAGGSGFGAQPVLAADPTRRNRYYLGIDSGRSPRTTARCS